jgi:tripartite-type tricarboxylate transporter receptor subunit TctC
MLRAVLVALGVLLGGLAAGPLQAQSYPSRPITLIVPYPAGGLSDLAVRQVAQEMSKRLNQSVVVDNRPGGSGTIGASYVQRAAPDGYTLLVNATGDVIRPHYMTVPYDIVNDFAPIGVIAQGPPMVLVVNPASPFKSVADLAAHARANPDKLNFGSSGPATGPATAILQFNASAKASLVDVPYRGASQAALAVVAGTIDGAFAYANTVKALIAEGKLRALAVTSASRTPVLPAVPTMIESGFSDFDIDGFVGLAAPRDTPADVVKLLNRELNAAVQDQALKARFANDGMSPAARNSPEDFVAYLKRELEKNRSLAQLAKPAAPK